MNTDRPRWWRQQPAADGRARPSVRAGVVALVVSAVAALVLVTLLAIQTLNASREQRRMAARTLSDYATFGATIFANRSIAIIVNASDPLFVILGASLERGEEPDVAAEKVFIEADSAVACKCGIALNLLETRVLNGTATRQFGLRTRNAGSKVEALPFDPNIVLADAGAAIRWRLYGSRSDGKLYVVRKLTSPSGRGAVIGVLVFEGESAERDVFQYVYGLRPSLLPGALLTASTNDSTIAITVQSADGKVFARYGPPVDSTHRVAIRFAEKNETTVLAELTPAAIEKLRTTVRVGPRIVDVLLLAILTMCAICAAVWFAWRSYKLGQLRMDFASSISHELRTPLTEIMLYAELIESGRTPRVAGTEQAARTIRGEARRLYQMVENVLHIARAERRLIRLSPSPESVATIIDELLTTYAPIAARRSVTISHEGDHTLRANVDPDAIRHVLLNLLDNAVRYGPVGQHIRIATVRNGTWLTITVDDEGPGVPAADRQRVFEPYVRLDRDVDRLSGGSGIGLAVVADLVSELSGRVRIESNANNGARFVLEFPVVEENNAKSDGEPGSSFVRVHAYPEAGSRT